MFNLGFHGSHNSTLAISKNRKVLEAVEVERFISHKNAALFYYESPPHFYNILRRTTSSILSLCSPGRDL